MLMRRVEEVIERRFEHVRDLAGVRAERQIGRDDAKHRRDVEAGDGAIGVGDADHLDPGRGQADLLVRLAQSGGDRAVVAGIDAAAGEADLAGMLAHRLWPECQDHARLGPLDDRDQHCGRRDAMPVRLLVERVAADQLGAGAMPGFERRAQRVGQAHGAGSNAKKAPPLHRPAGSLPSARASSASS